MLVLHCIYVNVYSPLSGAVARVRPAVFIAAVLTASATSLETFALFMARVTFIPPNRRPGSFVYTEVQVNVPFSEAPWQEINPVLKKQPGILSKTWLSGLHTNMLGGIYAFDTIESARDFALVYFPSETAKLNAAFYTRVFDASLVVEASRQLRSPFFT
jgi:hypothetical protein